MKEVQNIPKIKQYRRIKSWSLVGLIWKSVMEKLMYRLYNKLVGLGSWVPQISWPCLISTSSFATSCERWYTWMSSALALHSLFLFFSKIGGLLPMCHWKYVLEMKGIREYSLIFLNKEFQHAPWFEQFLLRKLSFVLYILYFFLCHTYRSAFRIFYVNRCICIFNAHKVIFLHTNWPIAGKRTVLKNII